MDADHRRGCDRCQGAAPGVKVATRIGRGRRLLFLLNHTEEEKEVDGVPSRRDLLSGRTGRGTGRLDRFGVAVVKL